MQSQQEQALTNISRLSAYRAKQTKDQRQRAFIAGLVSDYCKKLGLDIIQRNVAVKMALKQLDFSVSDDEAYKIGIKAARTIALANANERIHHAPLRYSNLH